MVTSSLSSNSSAFFSLQWNEFCDLLSGGTWDLACSQWSFENLTEPRRLALPQLARRFSESRQFLMTDHPHPVQPLEVLWLKLRLFAGLCTQLTSFYREYHRPHLGLESSRVEVLFPKDHDPILPARWDFRLRPFHQEEAAIPFVHDAMPPAFQSNLFQPPYSLDTAYKAPELREWPLGTSKEFTVLLRSMEKIRTQESTPNQVRGIFHIHLMSDLRQVESFGAQDVFCVQLPIPRVGQPLVNVWMSKIESPERGIMLRGQSEPMPLAAWDHIEAGKDRAIPQTSVQFYRAFSQNCDWFSLGLLWFQALIGRDDETLGRLEICLPNMVRGTKALESKHTEKLVDMGIDPIRLLFEEQGTLFNPSRLVNSVPTSSPGGQDLPRYLWDASLKLALQLVAREIPLQRPREKATTEPIDMGYHMECVLSRIRTIGEWIRMELFSPQQRRNEIMAACQKVRMGMR